MTNHLKYVGPVVKLLSKAGDFANLILKLNDPKRQAHRQRYLLLVQGLRDRAALLRARIRKMEGERSRVSDPARHAKLDAALRDFEAKRAAVDAELIAMTLP
jgi:hypothetical protein